ncbi:hypothetical protein F1654_08205 [Alkalicaulis satelles]|uniref:Uncharacterized protein n=1 Tax=Alkalicaulis satelles TaxID=2609175 RepID=A0A5M6ZNG3_9PROT|nr:hypothetical protein [Alkalicaulis satelles]KAA5803771.1 hypothetical protein F1654_08205 [Alkalicaulis satelles]
MDPTRHASLAPSGREISMEAAWRVQLSDEAVASFAARLTREPGHIAGARPEGLLWAGVRTRW